MDAENWANCLFCWIDDCRKLSNLGPVVIPTYELYSGVAPGIKLWVEKLSPVDAVK